MMIGGLSKATDCKVETIRYYEKIGMLPKPQRTERGHRLYGEEQHQRLNFIRRARTLGFTLKDIKNLLVLSGKKKTSCNKVRTIAKIHLEDVRGKIGDLRAMENVLQDMVERCQGIVAPDCPIIESLFREKIEN